MGWVFVTGGLAFSLTALALPAERLGQTGGLLIGAMILLPLARYVWSSLAPAARVFAGAPPHIPHRLNSRSVR